MFFLSSGSRLAISCFSFLSLRRMERAKTFAAATKKLSKKAVQVCSRVGFPTSVNFESLADTFLESLEEKLEILEESEILRDMHYSQGVLTIDMGTEGVWVINKQSPNKQLWWSSPKSGPMRFHLDEVNGNWRCTRDNNDLVDILRRELSSVAGFDFALD